MLLILLDSINNFTFDFLPESLDILIFGLLMILIAVGLRRVLSRNDEQRADKNFDHTSENLTSSQEISRNLGSVNNRQVQR